MVRKYFGTDGIRGRVGSFPITPEFVMKLGYATGRVLIDSRTSSSTRPAVLIGKDTRISGYMLEAALQSGFSAAGVDVMLAGPVPSPAVAYLTRALRLSAGLVLSASHNPYFDNGIKFFSHEGNKLPDHIESLIEQALNKPIDCAPPNEIGRAKRIDDARGRYIEFCKSTFPSDMDLKGMKIVIDCANGSAYHIAPEVFHELGAEVIVIGNNPNGFNINENFGATAPKNLCIKVESTKSHFGIALDGDADRLIMVDSNGKIYNGDELLYILAKDRLNLKNINGVVGTFMTNMAVETSLADLGVNFERAKIGDRYILEKLNSKGWELGGESSGHFLFLDKHTTGDGIISALQILSALLRSKKTLTESLENLNLWPQVLINVPVKSGFNWEKNKKLVLQKEKIESELGSEGRLLIRLSGTEPLLRIMVEARSEDLAKNYAKKIVSCIED